MSQDKQQQQQQQQQHTTVNLNVVKEEKDIFMDVQFSTPNAKIKQEEEEEGEGEKSVIPKPKTERRTTTTARRNLYELIDLTTPTKLLPSSRVENYVPCSLGLHNERRITILPTYPTLLRNTHASLLLANVPRCLLSAEQLTHRQPGQYPCLFTIRNDDSTMPSFMLKQYHTYFDPVLHRFKLDLSILDHNYARLQQVIDLIRAARIRAKPSNKAVDDLGVLLHDELPKLLEFYLQIDVDLFYMKTCSFRDAQPRSKVEGVFCSVTPECLYTTSKCRSCPLCTTVPSPVIFDRQEPRQFLNRYKTILNCPADCNTKNFIYVLTCTCQEVEYISESKFSLFEILMGHCQTTCNVIRKTLLGKQNLQLAGQQLSPKHEMLLYQHASQCATVMRMFLERNPNYRPFIPMLIEDARHDDAEYHETLTQTTAPRTFTAGYERAMETFIKSIPQPPTGYTFSMRQRNKQVQFFDKNMIKDPYDDKIFVLNAEIIAVMPSFSSDTFRRILHALFVTHTESQLNTLGHIFPNTENVFIRKKPWCYNLIRY